MILITGATGIVGANIASKLVTQHNQIYALKRKSSNLKTIEKIFKYAEKSHLINNIKWLEADILENEKIAHYINKYSITEVYHCSAMVSFDSADDEQVYKVNHIATKNLLSVSLEANIQKFCFISSIACLGRSDSSIHNPINEKDVITDLSLPISTYSKSKILAEQEVFKAFEMGLNTVVVNPSVIIAPGSWQSSSGKIFTQASKGLPFYTNGGTGFVDVCDVASIAILLMKKEIYGERFLLNAVNLSYKNLIDSIAVKLGVRKSFIPVSKNLLKIASFVETKIKAVLKKEVVISDQMINSLTGMTYYSGQKIVDRLAYKFRDVEESLSEYSRLYQSENPKK